ncbi:MAG: cupin domain-containing protein [Erysipelothrix sp.]|jgi:transcriptional regulator with XRE-family HTH domain|nr:cupin domain-containing protein [Erysipelothrix sp.]
MQIGQRIRKYRTKNGLTLEELASRTELTKGFLSQLENDLTSPSISTLADIVEALGVTLSQFFMDETNDQVVFGKEDFFVDKQENYTIDWIVPNAQKNKMEPIRLLLNEGGSSMMINPHEGEEFGYVLSGKVSLEIDGKKQIVKKGETFYLKGNTSHRLVNESKRESEILWVSTPPIF